MKKIWSYKWFRITVFIFVGIVIVSQVWAQTPSGKAEMAKIEKQKELKKDEEIKKQKELKKDEEIKKQKELKEEQKKLKKDQDSKKMKSTKISSNQALQKIINLKKVNIDEIHYNNGIKEIVKIVNSIGVISDSKSNLKYSKLSDSVADYKSYKELLKENKEEELLKSIKAYTESTNEGAIEKIMIGLNIQFSGRNQDVLANLISDYRNHYPDLFN